MVRDGAGRGKASAGRKALGEHLLQFIRMGRPTSTRSRTVSKLLTAVVCAVALGFSSQAPASSVIHESTPGFQEDAAYSGEDVNECVKQLIPIILKQTDMRGKTLKLSYMRKTVPSMITSQVLGDDQDNFKFWMNEPGNPIPRYQGKIKLTRIWFEGKHLCSISSCGGSNFYLYDKTTKTYPVDVQGDDVCVPTDSDSTPAPQVYYGGSVGYQSAPRVR